MKVKAYVRTVPNKPIKFGEVEITPKPSDLVIKSTHVGLSKGDLFILDNKWNATVYPAIGTGETVGIAESVGKDTQGFKEGDRVGIGYILGSCMNCEYCNKGLHHYCSKQINTELGGWGGMAEIVAVDYRLVVKIPDGIDSADATPLLGYGVTAYSGIKKANLDENSNVGVVGLGGLGHILVKLLNAMKMNVTVFSHSPDKKQLAENLGVNGFALTTNQEEMKTLYKKFHLIVNSSSADLNLSSYLEFLRADGKFCYLGLPFNKQQFNAPRLADYGSRSVYGSYVGSMAETNELLSFALNKKPLTDIAKYPIKELEKAIEFIQHGNSHKRVVLYW